MALVRHDGTLLVHSKDIDRDYLGKMVLLDCREFPGYEMGYLVASCDANRQDGEVLAEIMNNEFGTQALLWVGSKERGEMILGYY